MWPRRFSQHWGLIHPKAMAGTNLAPEVVWGGKRKVLLISLTVGDWEHRMKPTPFSWRTHPVWDGLLRDFPWSRLRAAGEAVGLEPGKAGNSEAGHINLGAGRIVLQDDVRLDRAMQEGSFFTNEVICGTIDSIRSSGKYLHLIGLLTEKSSHGSIEYPAGDIENGEGPRAGTGFPARDLSTVEAPNQGSAPALIKKLQIEIGKIGIGRIVSGIGRGIALDRDGNYEKTKRAFDLMVSGTGRRCRGG